MIASPIVIGKFKSPGGTSIFGAIGVIPVAQIGNSISRQSDKSLIIPSVIKAATPRTLAIVDITPPQKLLKDFELKATTMTSPGFAISIALRARISSPGVAFTVIAGPAILFLTFQTGLISIGNVCLFR